MTLVGCSVVRVFRKASRFCHGCVSQCCSKVVICFFVAVGGYIQLFRVWNYVNGNCRCTCCGLLGWVFPFPLQPTVKKFRNFWTKLLCSTIPEFSLCFWTCPMSKNPGSFWKCPLSKNSGIYGHNISHFTGRELQCRRTLFCGLQHKHSMQVDE